MASSAKKSKMELVLEISAKYKYINPSKNFLSEPMLNYILKNSSQKAYYKLIQISKYFLVNQPPQIKKLKSFDYYGNEMLDSHRISEIIGNRLWINSENFTWRCSSVPVNGFLQRCFRINIGWLDLKKQELTYDELKLLMDGNNITFLELDHCSIMHSNGESIALEDILKMVPRLEEIHYNPCEPFTFSCQKVAGLEDFWFLKTVNINGITEDFNFCASRNFLKKLKCVASGRFKFANVSPGYLRKFQIAVLKEVNPSIEVKSFSETIFFGEFDDEEW